MTRVTTGIKRGVAHQILILLVCVMELAIVESAFCQESGDESRVPDDARQLVVHLRSYFVSPPAFEVGAGIVIGVSLNTVFVATARHLVYKNKWADRLEVYFEADPETALVGGLHRFAGDVASDSTLDLAVVLVETTRTHAQRLERSFDRLAQMRRLRPTDAVNPVGCPAGTCWGTGPSDQIMSIEKGKGSKIYFSSFFVTPGSSGGALFDAHWELVGMVVKGSQPLAEALSIAAVLDRVRAWNVPVSLKKPLAPRAGYESGVGLTFLTSTTSDVWPSGRFPSGRIEISRRLAPLLSGHVAVQRLTPADLSVTSGLVGLRFGGKVGRFVPAAFLEGGFARVEGRFDAGGYVRREADKDVYVPFWNQVKDEGLGFGVGLNVGFIAASHVILQFFVGHWDFNGPARAPDPPDFFVGWGVQLGN